MGRSRIPPKGGPSPFRRIRLLATLYLRTFDALLSGLKRGTVIPQASYSSWETFRISLNVNGDERELTLGWA